MPFTEPLLGPWIAQLHALKPDDLPTGVAEAVCGRILDSLGCALGAWDSDSARIARRMASRIQPAEGDPGSRIWGTKTPTTPDMAAFANGVMVRYLDFNDTYLSKEPAHPSDNIPALLAVAESSQASGPRLLMAIAIAYEIQCRLCDAASLRSQGWDHVNYGALSVSLAASWLLGLSPEITLQAASLATTGHLAIRQTRVGELSHWKGCAFANTARNAVWATQLAQLGLTGPRAFIEGEMGFMAQTTGAFEWPALFGGGDGRRTGDWMLLQTYIKHYPAEYHAQSAIEAALMLRDRLPTGSVIDHVQLDTFDAAADIIAGFSEHWQPQSRETADHSMPYCVTVALLDGDITLASFEAARRNDPAVLDLLSRVSVQRDAELSRQYPQGGIPNRVTVTLSGGQTLSETVTYPLGHASHPMTRPQIEAKFFALANGRLPTGQANTLADQVWGLPNRETITSLSSFGPVISGQAL